MRVELTVQVSGKEDSEALSYNAVPKSVSAEQWALIAGAGLSVPYPVHAG